MPSRDSTGISELLSFFDLLNPAAIAISWLLLLPLLRAPFPHRPSVGWIEWALLVPVFLLVLVLGFIAWVSPPNVFDAMTYHLPRVVAWAQHGNVNFFATPYLNPLQMPPFAEYFTLHTWLLTGGDRLANFAQWLGYTGSIVAVSVLAREFALLPKVKYTRPFSPPPHPMPSCRPPGQRTIASPVSGCCALASSSGSLCKPAAPSGSRPPPSP